jgi:hypothetical protein
MEIDKFRSALRTRPFKPFQIRTASGESYPLIHPETVGVTPSGKTIAIALDEGVAVLDVASITEYVLGVTNRWRKGPKAE